MIRIRHIVKVGKKVGQLTDDVINLLDRSGGLDKMTGWLQADVVSLAEVVKTTDGWQLDVGVRARRGEDIVMRAMANEFGTQRIPERSFLRSTLDQNRDRYADILVEALERVPDGESPERAMSRLGAIVVGDVQRKITEIRYPPNAPSTVKRKGSANPLIDTGQLRQAIDFRVRRPEERSGDDEETEEVRRGYVPRI